MRKLIILLALIGAVVLTLLQFKTDTSPARLAYVAAVQDYTAADSELADYNISPIDMAECVVELTEGHMRGFSSSISRIEQLGMYEKWVRIKSGEKGLFTDAQSAKDFGMKVVGQGAHTTFGTSYQYCIERVAPHNQEQILADEDWVANKKEELSKWWADLIK